MQMVQVVGISAILVVGLSALSVYFWRRAASLYSLLVEGAGRYEELRRRSSALDAAFKEQESKVRDFHQKSLQADKAASEARHKTQELLKDLEDKTREVVYVTDKLERQKGYLETVVAKQAEQLKAQEALQSDLTARLEEQRIASADKLQIVTRDSEVQIAALRQELRTLGASYERMQTEQQSLVKRASEGDPLEIKRLRRKITQYARLYIMMKGLKEMAEERSQNWMVALTKLSTWVVQEKQGPKAMLPNEAGPLVGTALKLIGQQLIHDEDDGGLGPRSAAAAMPGPSLRPVESHQESLSHEPMAAASPAETEMLASAL